MVSAEYIPLIFCISVCMYAHVFVLLSLGGGAADTDLLVLLLTSLAVWLFVKKYLLAEHTLSTKHTIQFNRTEVITKLFRYYRIVRKATKI